MHFTYRRQDRLTCSSCPMWPTRDGIKVALWTLCLIASAGCLDTNPYGENIDPPPRSLIGIALNNDGGLQMWTVACGSSFGGPIDVYLYHDHPTARGRLLWHLSPPGGAPRGTQLTFDSNAAANTSAPRSSPSNLHAEFNRPLWQSARQSDDIQIRVSDQPIGGFAIDGLRDAATSYKFQDGRDIAPARLGSEASAYCSAHST